jgi:hypothetical protein
VAIALPAGFGGPVPGFTVTDGYDLATGWGSPIANNLVPALAAKGDDVCGGGGNQAMEAATRAEAAASADR